MKLLGISGSLRKESFATALLKGLQGHLSSGTTLEIFSLVDVPFYNQDLDTEQPPSGVVALRKAITEADGVIFSSPEYNYGTSGVLKNTIDWASRPNGKSCLVNKPVLIMTSSPGALGGARAQVHLLEPLFGNKCRVVQYPQITVSAVHQKVKDGKITDDATLKFILGGVEALEKM